MDVGLAVGKERRVVHVELAVEHRDLWTDQTRETIAGCSRSPPAGTLGTVMLGEVSRTREDARVVALHAGVPLRTA